MSDDIEYKGMIAAAWDLLRGDTSTWPDRPFWREILTRRGGASLDVGCGTGRLLLDYLADGFDVDGVDNSPDMLALCREKAARAGLDLTGRLFQQEMAHLSPPRRYTTIFIPSLTFMLLTDDAAAQAALERFHEALEPGGLLIASFSAKLWPGRDIPPHHQWSDWYVLAEAVWPEDGLTVRRWVRGMYDHALQLEHEENRYELLRGEEIVRCEHHRRSPCVRWYRVPQAIAAFERAGFTDVYATRGESAEPAAADEGRNFKVFGTRR